MQNEPNLLGVKCAKRSQFGPAWAGPRRAEDAKRTQFAGRRAGAGGTDRAKQSQLAPWKMSGEDAQPTKGRGAMMRNKANLAESLSAGGGGQSCKTNPIPAIMPIGRSAFPGGPSCETKPIGRRSRYPTISVWHQPGVPSRGNPHQLLDAGWSGSERPPRYLARNFSAAAKNFRRFSGLAKPWPSSGKTMYS